MPGRPAFEHRPRLPGRALQLSGRTGCCAPRARAQPFGEGLVGVPDDIHGGGRLKKTEGKVKTGGSIQANSRIAQERSQGGNKTEVLAFGPCITSIKARCSRWPERRW